MAGLAFARMAKALGGLAAPVITGLEVVGAATVMGAVMNKARAGDNKPKSKGPGVM